MSAATLPNIRRLALTDAGRIGRRDFWLFVLCAIALAVCLVSFPAMGLPTVRPVIISLLLIYPSYCVVTKRLHDIGLDGRWALVMTSIAAIDTLWVAAGPAAGLAGSVTLVRGLWWWIALANTLAFIALGLWPGEKMHNHHGAVAE